MLKDGVPCAGSMAFNNLRKLPGTGDSTPRLLLLLALSSGLFLLGAFLFHRKGKARL